MVKYLFLDIDGVLNSDEYYIELYRYTKGKTSESYRFYPEGTASDGYQKNIDRAAVELVNRICKETGAKIVLSSSWRIDNACTSELAKLGIEVSDYTPYIPSRHRGTEIKKFLDTHRCSSYCILDDDTDMLDSQLSNFVPVDFHFGLTKCDADSAIEILGKD
jgi:hypothetical protein